MTVKINSGDVRRGKGTLKGGSKMRKVSLSCLFLVLSLLLVASVFAQPYPYISGRSTPFPPASGIPPLLDLRLSTAFPPPPPFPAPGQGGAEFGTSIAIADFDGDSKGEIVVGAPLYDIGDEPEDGDRGRVYVYSGAGGCLYRYPAGCTVGVDCTFEGILEYPDNAPNAQFGYAVAVGDIDGDTIPDLIVSAPYGLGFAEDDFVEQQGRVYVFFGPDFVDYNVIDKPADGQSGALFGFSLAVGDLNGSGGPEIVVGSPGERIGTFDNAGVVYTFFPDLSGGRAAGGDALPLDDTTPFASHILSVGDQAEAQYGYAVAIGDIDGDGTNDLIVSAPFWDNPGAIPPFGDQGIVEYWGSTSGVVRIFYPNLQGAVFFGFSVAAADISNPPDGVVEVIIGAPHDDNLFIDDGAVYVFNRNNLIVPVATYTSPNSEGGGSFGFFVTAGDIDRDGIPDVLVGAPFEDLVSAGCGGLCFDSGKAYAFTSSVAYDPGGLLYSTPFAGPPAGLAYFDGDQDATWFGWAIAVGEVNNVKTAVTPYDIAIGGIHVDVNGFGEQGRVFLFSEDVPPEAPTHVRTEPALVGGVLQAKVDVDIKADPMKDRNIATCGIDYSWTDVHTATEWKIYDGATFVDCDTPGEIADFIVTTPPLTELEDVNFFTDYGFNFGDQVVVCVSYYDAYDVFSPWSTLSFTIGQPDPTVTAAEDVLEDDSPYADPVITLGPHPGAPPGPPGPDRVNFQTVACADCRTVDITVTNNGTAPMHIFEIIFQSNASGPGSFALNSHVPGLVDITLGIGETEVFNVTFCGGGVGGGAETHGRLGFRYDDPIAYRILLQGFEASPIGDVQPDVGPNPTVPPFTTVDLGDFIIGAPPVTFNVTVAETACVGVPLKVTAVSLTEVVAPPPEQYTWQWAEAEDQAYWDENGFLYIDSCESKTIIVTFDPKTGSGCGPRDAQLDVTHNGNPTVVCTDLTETIMFHADVDGPDLEGRWTSFSSSFGSTLVRGTLRVANIGNIDLALAPIPGQPTDHFRVRFYLSTDAILDTSDISLNFQDVTYLLRAGQVKTIGFNYDFNNPGEGVPAGSQSGKFVLAVIDSEQNFYECIDFINPMEPPLSSPELPLGAYFPFPPGNANINNIAVPAKFAIGAFSIP
jgi:hypothetical protein